MERPLEMVHEESIAGHRIFFEPFDATRTRMTVGEYRRGELRQVGQSTVIDNDVLRCFAQTVLDQVSSCRDAFLASHTNWRRSQRH